MRGTAPFIDHGLSPPRPADKFARLHETLQAATPSLLFGLRLWASVSLALYVAFWLELDAPYWAGTSAAIVCQPQLGASLRKGGFRMIGTLIGGVMSVVLVACFPQDRVLFLGGLALWAAVCAFASTLLRNFASYAAALSGYTVAIIGGELLGTVGGVDADSAFLLAVSRVSEICIGIVCASIVLAGTDFGGAPRKLAAQLAGLSAEITHRFLAMFAKTRLELGGQQAVWGEFAGQVLALDPLIDRTIGESSRLRDRSPVLEKAVDGLIGALANWRTVVQHLDWLPDEQAQQEGAIILRSLPLELRSPEQSHPARWIADPIGLKRICETAARRLTALPASTPSLRLMADRAAAALAGMADAANALALLVDDPAQPVARGGIPLLRIPDWLPALVNAGRAFVVIGAVSLFWIVTAWPGGGVAITFASIVVILLAPRADLAYAAAIIFTVGALLDLILTAIITFAVLPGLGTETFLGFSLVIGACLVPIGALLAQARQPWQVGLFTAMTLGFMPLLHPTNPMNYDTLQFYNAALAIVGSASAAALSFRLLPPLSPTFRARRLLALTLRDLRRLAIGHTPADWEGRIYGRFSDLSAGADPSQCRQLLAALSVGGEILRLRHVASRLGVGPEADAALTTLARGERAATAQLAQLDRRLAALPEAEAGADLPMRARASILAITEALARYPAFFDSGARP